MLNWLNDSPGFPVSENAENQNREAANPHGYTAFPVSRFSRFQNEGAAQQQDETANACEKNTPSISQPLPELLNAVAARLGPAVLDDLQTQAGTNPERLAELCGLALAVPPSPTPEDAAELDALMVRLCELELWLAGYLPEMRTARRCMAPANVAESLACFRRWVREAEARRGAVLGAGDGKPSALKNGGGAQASRQEKESPRLDVGMKRMGAG
ncbi:MAG: hypothetical protein K0M58_12015 [Thiobacillus sp.]|nr:hypothetical protein [Thiobacillus sp.]